ncbi:hypothetical protein FBU30_001803 [Linnemannia zychae]|nr:hypothetical protein FBU30_001803 [Linnemannia zychae]
MALYVVDAAPVNNTTLTQKMSHSVDFAYKVNGGFVTYHDKKYIGTYQCITPDDIENRNYFEAILTAGDNYELIAYNQPGCNGIVDSGRVINVSFKSVQVIYVSDKPAPCEIHPPYCNRIPSANHTIAN